MSRTNYTDHWNAFALKKPTTTIPHAAYMRAIDGLKRIIATPDDTWLAQLVAPTGAGKTHTATVLHGEILDLRAKEIAADPTYMPSVYVSMSLLADKAAHNWKDDYWKILVALNHPNPRSRDLSEAREKLKTALTKRRTEVLILDEAAHFISGCKPNDVAAIKRRANVVKSLTEDTQTRLLLCATFDLLPMIRVDGQLARRNQVVHLERYRNTDRDRTDFATVLASLDKEYSKFLAVSLADSESEIYEGCVGLIGVLRNWLVRAATAAEHGGRRGITKEDLKATKLSLLDLIPILEEAMNGEEQLAESDETKTEFQRLLKSDKRKLGDDELRPPNPEEDPQSEDEPADDHNRRGRRAPPTAKRRPGRRKPARTPLDGPEAQ